MQFQLLIFRALELEDQLFAEKARSKSVRATDDLTLTWDRIYNLTEVKTNLAIFLQ